MSEAEEQGGRRYRGVSREDRREERRLKLIQAAIAIFGSKGYHTSTVRSICQEAGVTERYFYESFENSEDLLCAAYDLLTERMRTAIMMAVASVPLEPELMAKTALSTLYQAIQEDPPAARLQFIEILGVSPRVDERYRASVESFAGLFTLLATRLHSTEQARQDYQAEWLATGLVGAAVTIAHRWILEDFKTPREVVVNNAYAIARAVVRFWLTVPDEA